MTRTTLLLLVCLAIVVAASSALAHCQMPCGIYDDPMRFSMLDEHVAAIEKAMTEIERLGKEEPTNFNQIVRWVSAKETEADELSEVVSYYFMTQRVKPADPKDEAAYAKYVREITLLHEMLVSAMKSKQTTDVANCAKLRELIAQFKKSYLAEAATEVAPKSP
jgi:nickel superoxide dismutase